MNGTIVKNILNVIKKSNDKSVIVKALVKLRTDIVKDREGIVLFRDAGGIAPMIRLLNRPYEKILEIVLSILGNCCTDKECCVQAFELKIIPPLITILKSVPNPLIQCRACRLLGNLAKENKSQLINYSAATSQSLCLILEESTDLQTRIMATRAVKFLLNDEQFLKSFIKFDGYKILINILVKIMKYNENPIPIEVPTKPVGLKLNQHREKYFEEVCRHLEGVRSDIFDNEILKNEKKVNVFSMPDDKNNLDLVHEILKCVQSISEVQSPGYVVEFCMEPGLSCIVFFAEASNTFRTVALKVISNFSKNLFARSALAAADAVVAACELLTTSATLITPLTETEKKYCINTVCMLSTDACNRAKIRRSGALKKLIEIAKTTDSYTEISAILFALINFQYDNISMDLMLREGLVGILIKELNAYLNGADELRKKKCEEKLRTSRKRKTEEGEINQPVNKTAKFWEFYYEDSPIGSPSNLSPSSPNSCRSLSPISNSSKNFIENDFESETYSPVCSETDDDSEEEEKCPEPEDFDVMKLLDIAFKNDTNLEDNLSEKEDDEEMSQDTTSLKLPCRNPERNAIDIIDKLLFKVSVSVGNRGELGKPETLSTLIRAINIFGMNSTVFGSSLTNILSESQFFATILKQNVIHQLCKMTRVDELKFGGINFIDTLSCVAESGYGRGEVTKLLNIESFVQKRTAIAVAFIIKQPRLLYQLLTENGALYILLNTILNKDDEYRIEAADAITSLAQTLKITIPNCDEKLKLIQEFDESTDFPTFSFSSDTQKTCNDNEMKFLLNRGCSQIPIKFNKKILTDSSEVFNSMLNSDFRESNEGLVRLKDYSVNGIKYFLNLIHLKSVKQSPNIPPIYYFDSILEAYELSKMYIIVELEKLLFNMLIHRLNSKTCLKVFEWSFKNANYELSEIAINYYLCSELDGIEKVDLFREADYSKYSKEWNQMMTDAILVKCQNLFNDIK